MIHLNKVNFKYPNSEHLEKKYTFKDLELKIDEGSFTCVIGTNGAGKSTLMQLLTGIVKPSSGNININNRSINHLPEYKRAAFIGRVFQDPLKGSAASLTVYENLCLARRSKNKHLSFFKNKNFSLEMKKELKNFDLGLENHLNTPIGLLSGGQRQVVSLLMSTMGDPQVLLLDEHTSALDPKTADLVMLHTKRVIEEKKLTTLMITHNMEHALKYGDRLLMLNSGQICRDFNLEQKTKMSVEELYILFSKLSHQQNSIKLALAV